MVLFKKDKRKLNVPIIVFSFLLFISGTLLALSSGGFLVGLKDIGFSAVSLVQKGVYTVTSSVAETVTAVHEIAVLREEYEKLTAQLRNYEYLQRSNAEIRKENERLREQIGISDTFDYVNYPAYIIGRDPNNLFSALTISKGTKDGIRKNMPVIAVQDGNVALVGKIVNVGYSTSMVMPVYDFQCNIAARIQNTRDIGLVSGSGSADSPLMLRYIKKRAADELQYGDIVVTSGENDNYLRDIPIGTISKITALDYDSSLEIELQPSVDFARLEIVLVVDMQSKRE